ncbi:MAG: phospholipid carrier-dependent glycosyltransferase [Nitrospina sp.]|jgi:4-amino-4-deoxy-L-arabinose transferase-like glycosyltransferase|nr:phospholipid carrier-dependent glycosyltransferase [Nitrospina sp.]MBT6718590.1 phospholipid carrier-dependent glycosyltransferase [Nitrospina sp.]
MPSLNQNEESLKPYLLMGPALLAAFLFSWSIFHSDLSKREAREGVPVVNMMQGGNLWLPQIHPQQLRTKPPLFYWSGLLSSKIMGEVTEVSLRIPSVLAGAGTVLLTTFLGMRLFSPLIGCLAGLIITTCWRFAYLGSHARIDMLFVFFITLAFVALWEFSRDQKQSLKWWAGIAIGLAVLTKGPLGWVFPLLTLFIFCRSHKTFKVPWLHILFLPIGMSALWLAFGIIDGGEEFSKMIYQETVGRISGSEAIHIHPKPFYYYIPQIFVGMAPWSLFLPFAIGYGLKNQDISWKFCAITFATLFIFLSLFPGKRGDYLLPLYPMAAVILAAYFSRIAPEIKQGLSFPTWIVMGMMMVLVLILGFSALLPNFNFESFSAFLNSRDRWMAQLLYDNHRPPTLFLIVGTLGMVLFWLSLRKALNQNSGIQVSGVITGWAFVLFFLVHGPAARIVNEYSSLRPFAEKIKQVANNRPVYKYGKIREDLFYYMDGKIQEVHQDTTELFQQPEALLLIRKTHEPSWLKDFPGGKNIIEMDAGFETYMLLEKTNN